MYTMTDNASDNLPEIMLNRPKEAASEFRGLIQEALPEARVIISPLIKIKFLSKLIDFTRFDTLIFTSVNGVHAIENQRVPRGKLCFAVGEKTAQAAEKIGFEALYSNGNYEDLVSMILSHPRSGKFLHVRGKYTRGDISRALSESGRPCEQLIAYHQKSVALTNQAKVSLKRDKPLILPIFSPRTARLLMKKILPNSHFHIIAMSNNIAKICKENGYANITTSKKPSAKSMLEEVIKIYKLVSRLEAITRGK